MLSWEFPPLVVGGLGRHVAALARELGGLGHDVHVLTRGLGITATTENVGGITVVRAAADPLAIDFTAESVLGWSQAFEHSLTRAGLALLRTWQPEVIHAHDWLVTQSAHTLHEVSGVPIVATIHATEYGRQQGWLSTPLQAAIHSLERWLCAGAATVITCSGFMADEVAGLFDLRPNQIRVIGNGIDPAPRANASLASKLAATGPPVKDGPAIVFAGRLVHEKGLQELIKALPLLIEDFPHIRLDVAGDGPLLAQQKDRARRYGVDGLIEWHGRLADPGLAELMVNADVVVVPSLYEPFGLVALEAQACRTPVAVADTGGLRDLIEPGVTGERFAIESPRAIADAIRRLLGNPGRTATMAANAQQRAIANFSWAAVAKSVTSVYQEIQTPSASTD
jgi:glycogen(starch) synthase